MFIYAGIVFVASVGITFTFLSIFMCTPVQRGWDKCYGPHLADIG